MTGSFARGLEAKAVVTASESFKEHTADRAADGSTDTRWSTVPGHVEGNWLQLEWPEAVEVGEVVIEQYDRFSTYMDVQVWDDSAGEWRTVQELGQPNLMLPKVVFSRFEPVKTTRLRLANITGGCSITELHVSEKAFASYKPVIALASDANGGFIGIVTDPWGSAPMAGAEVELSGESRGGQWETTARTDDRGLFFAPMPVGLTGTVTARTADSEVFQADAAGFSYGLTPLSTDARTTSLNGKWRFSMDPPDGFWETGFDDGGWSDINVPAHWEMEGFTSYDQVGGYRKRFDAPPGEGRLKLRFDGVYSGAEVWVNGQRLAYHEGGANAFDVDITDVLRSKGNVVALRVSEKTFTSANLDKMSFYANFPLAGIWRAVYLYRVPEVHIGALAVETRFDPHYRDALLSGRVAVVNESGGRLADASLRFSLAGPDGGPVPLDRRPAAFSADPWSLAVVQFELPVKEPRKWNAEQPNLYTLTIELRQGSRVLQTLKQRIGLRQVEVEGTRILVNGAPVKFRGTSHHDGHPLMGRAVTPEITRKDLELIKEANLNALRTSHYPPIPELLDFADEMGVYVECEAPMCWVNNSDDLRNTPRIIQLAAEMVARHRNHPSIFMWSVCNESAYGYGLRRCCEWVKKAEPSRPVTASGTANVDIATRHNPITTQLVELMDEKATLPIIWDESFALFQGIFGEVAELWVDPGMRDYYIEPFIECYDRFIKSPTVSGHMIWCWADDLFCVPGRSLEYGRVNTFCHFLDHEYAIPGRGIVGDAPWGLVDGWRRRKPEFWLHKKLESPVRISEAVVPIPAAGEPIRISVTNYYDFANLSELKSTWRIGKEQGEVKVAVPPRDTGAVEIRPAGLVRSGDVLELEFADSWGLVDAYRIPIGREKANPPPVKPLKAGPLRVVEENNMAGYGTRVLGEEFELSISKGSWGMGSGYLMRSTVLRQPMLFELPTLHVLPMQNALRPTIDVLTWKAHEISVQPEGENARIMLKGTYDDFEGGYDILVTPSGDMTVHSSFRYTGQAELPAREVGLRFSVPKSCDLLQWDRRAEWRVYPDDHIGRPRGSSRAFKDHSAEVPPTCNWSEDNTPMGCNDFRGTKRRVNWASVTYPDGPGVLVLSDGTQHVRATVGTDRISVHVNDYYGGSNVGRWRPSDLRCFSDNYGDGQIIRNGDVVESRLRMRFVR